jgi:hypothetical protein
VFVLTDVVAGWVPNPSKSSRSSRTPALGIVS